MKKEIKKNICDIIIKISDKVKENMLYPQFGDNGEDTHIVVTNEDVDLFYLDNEEVNMSITEYHITPKNTLYFVVYDFINEEEEDVDYTDLSISVLNDIYDNLVTSFEKYWK